MSLLIEATRDLPMELTDKGVVNTISYYPENRRKRLLDSKLSIKVYGDLCEFQSPLQPRHLVTTVDCTYYEAGNRYYDSSQDETAIKSANTDSDILVCSVEFDEDISSGLVALQELYTIISGVYKEKFDTEKVPVICAYFRPESYTKAKTICKYLKRECFDSNFLIIFHN